MYAATNIEAWEMSGNLLRRDVNFSWLDKWIEVALTTIS